MHLTTGVQTSVLIFTLSTLPTVLTRRDETCNASRLSCGWLGLPPGRMDQCLPLPLLTFAAGWMVYILASPFDHMAELVAVCKSVCIFGVDGCVFVHVCVCVSRKW